MNNIKEKGEASILIELKDGNITVYHGTEQAVLLQKDSVESGSWDRIWETLKALK